MKTALCLAASLLLCTAVSAAVPSSINNDDSCDIKVGPAATLLLPYFEVDADDTTGRTTLFTITNVSRYPQIAHVTIWTDWAFPVMAFNLYLTGYGVQAVNMTDVIKRSAIAPPNIALTNGALSTSTNGNLGPLSDCDASYRVPASLAAAVHTVLRTGVYNPGGGVAACSSAGGVHADAIGYATIDVVSNCTSRFPTDPAYYTNDLLFDNVLIGDYQQIGASPAGTGTNVFDAAGNPMVHIRAVPEGGGAGSRVATGLPYTFYDRYTPAAMRTIDRRQPLPSTFAARYIQGGLNAFATNFTAWREGLNGAGASCASYVNNSELRIAEVVRFDEHENPFTLGTGPFCTCSNFVPTLPATSLANTASLNFPALGSVDVGGWIYLNLNNGGSYAYSVTGYPSGTTTAGPAATPFGKPRASQNWVTVGMFGNAGNRRMTAELDATPLGNGCSPASLTSSANFGPVPIGPAGGVFICPPGTTLTNGTTALCTGSNANPMP